ncbi:MAG: right-handed parallel beta-helix repeat-containing protein [Planctomycetota bacterium]|jgi:parallel beta-helix repeat protein
MKPKYLNAAIVVLSLLVMGTQPALGTKYIPSDTSIGTWDSVNRVYTLTTDVSEAIQIDEDNLTLDGAGHTVTGPGTGHGVNLSGRTGVTLKGLTVQGFSNGISLFNSSSNTLSGNSVQSHYYAGIYLRDSSTNTLTANTVNSNTWGIYLYESNDNTVTDNTVESNNQGILVQDCSGNTLTGNTTSSNSQGIFIASVHGSSSNNTITDNTADNNHEGIRIEVSNNNIEQQHVDRQQHLQEPRWNSSAQFQRQQHVDRQHGL